jgi:malonyl CoA-acyl carrier protein transacylase
VSVATLAVVGQIAAERRRQDEKWGQQSHPDGTGGAARERYAIHLREECEEAFAEGRGRWAHILEEEVAEAVAESDPAKLREELVQVAAVATAWVEHIDRRLS